MCINNLAACPTRRIVSSWKKAESTFQDIVKLQMSLFNFLLCRNSVHQQIVLWGHEDPWSTKELWPCHTVLRRMSSEQEEAKISFLHVWALIVHPEYSMRFSCIPDIPEYQNLSDKLPQKGSPPPPPFHLNKMEKEALNHIWGYCRYVVRQYGRLLFMYM